MLWTAFEWRREVVFSEVLERRGGCTTLLVSPLHMHENRNELTVFTKTHIHVDLYCIHIKPKKEHHEELLSVGSVLLENKKQCTTFRRHF